MALFGKSSPAIGAGDISTTSLMALKLSCLRVSGNDLDRAAALYAYLSEGLADTLPAADPAPVSGLQRVREGADEVLGWLGSHKEEIAQGVALIKSLRPAAAPAASAAATAVDGLAAIPKI